MFKSMRLRFRARWWFVPDTMLLLFAVKAEFDAVTRAQLSDYARDGAR